MPLNIPSCICFPTLKQPGMCSHGRAYSEIMQNKCIFIKDPFQSIAYMRIEDRLCILNLQVKITWKILLSKHFLLSPKLTEPADTQDTSQELGVMHALFLLLATSSHSSQHKGLILYNRMTEERTLQIVPNNINS